ncbi:hypothetical protein [Nocardia tengchongensis]|uniref:hypothetical protein n=1 Tax=Nocardia tengchongensis TaxID=2055889 RepID=UPI0036AB0AFE
MSSAIDRMWNIRDAVLEWLYIEHAELRSPSRMEIDDIQRAVGWQVDPITEDELDRDAGYLREKDYIRATDTFGRTLLRPKITALGADFAARGVSVRPGPERVATTNGVTNNFNITNNAPSQMAFNSSGVTQTMTIEGKRQQINGVADALERFADNTPEVADRARDVAGELRAASADPEANASKIQTLLTTVAGIGALVNSDAGQQLMQMAGQVLQALPF